MVLGLLGRDDEAVAALEAALALEEAIECSDLHRPNPVLACSALLQRDDRGDRERATVELGRSIETAEQLGMRGLALAGRRFTEHGHEGTN